MKIDVQPGYAQSFLHDDCGLECTKAYCPVHRYLWRTCTSWECPRCVHDARVMMAERICQEASNGN